MPEISASQYADILFRWFHVIFGVMWIGLLYFFNFVNANFAAALDADTKKKVVPELMPRALFFFRWAAMITFIAGLILLYINYLMPGAGASMNSDRGTWIMVGAGFGTIMWFNVWFIIWPNQRKIINGLKTGNLGPSQHRQTSGQRLQSERLSVLPHAFRHAGNPSLSLRALVFRPDRGASRFRHRLPSL